MDFLHNLLTAPFDFIKDYGGPFIIVLSILVAVHEWGHYIVARLCGVKVEKFSIGFGPELFGRNDKNGTRWKVSLIPLGGYVQMFGDTDPASAHHADGVKEGGEIRPFTKEEKKVAFYAQPVGRRAAIVFAGPAINYIFAIIILSGLYMTQGQPLTPPIAAGVVEKSAAAAAGIRPDDKIISINGEPIRKFEDIKKFVMINLDQPMHMEVLRATGKNKWATKPTKLTATPRVIVEEDRFGFKHTTGRLGISSPSKVDFAMEQHTFFSAIGAATMETWTISLNTLEALGQMITGIRSADELGGILRIGAYAGEFAAQGLISFITFAALLSINLGLINLLPIPMLDGGHLTMYAMEKLRGKPLSEKVQEYALRVGLTFLLGIMVFATWNDLVQMKVFDYVAKLIS
jgi:regulator of sigma E protease